MKLLPAVLKIPRRPFSHRPTRISACEQLEPRRMMDATTVEVDITPRTVRIEGRTTQNVAFNINLHAMNGSLSFTGDNISEQDIGNRVVIIGATTFINSVLLSNTSNASSISLHIKGSSTIEVQNFTSSGPSRSIDLTSANLTGSFQAVAPNVLRIGSGSQGRIGLSSSGEKSVNFKGGDFTDMQFQSTAPLSAFVVDQWSGNTARISTGKITQFKANVIDGSVILNPSPAPPKVFNTLSVNTIGPGSWLVNGDAGAFSAGSTDANWTATFQNLDRLKLTATASGSVTATAIKDIRTTADMQSMNINLTQAFGAAKWASNTILIGGSMVDSTIASNNSIRSISMAGMNRSELLIGTQDQSLPVNLNGFANGAIIQTLKVGGKKNFPGFMNSRLASPFISKFVLSPVLVSQFLEISTRQIDDFQGVPLMGSTLGAAFHIKHVITETDVPTALQTTLFILTQ